MAINSRASKDLIYRAKGMLNRVAGKAKAYHYRKQAELKKAMTDYGWNP